MRINIFIENCDHGRSNTAKLNTQMLHKGAKLERNLSSWYFLHVLQLSAVIFCGGLGLHSGRLGPIYKISHDLS